MDCAPLKIAAVAQQPLDCTKTDALDLCVRRRSPSPEGAAYNPPTPPTSALCFSSPGSHAGSESSLCSTESAYQDIPIQKIKTTRPFKAYPKDPLALTAAEVVLSKTDASNYVEFRKRMLSQVQQQNQGTNIKMRRTNMTNGDLNGDPNYWEKRRKNNEAAKRSRDARRAKEDEIAIRCAYLEQENMKLRFENASLRTENERLRNHFYN